jgi:hypothetical protein
LGVNEGEMNDIIDNIKESYNLNQTEETSEPSGASMLAPYDFIWTKPEAMEPIPVRIYVAPLSTLDITSELQFTDGRLLN